jgi:hypothetical protein
VTVAIVVAVVAVAVVVAVLVLRPRRSDDDIADFRRQIDALSKESRRPIIDRMNPSDDPPADDDGDDEPEATS